MGRSFDMGRLIPQSCHTVDRYGAPTPRQVPLHLCIRIAVCHVQDVPVIASQLMSLTLNQKIIADLFRSLTSEQQRSVVRFAHGLADQRSPKPLIGNNQQTAASHPTTLPTSAENTGKRSALKASADGRPKSAETQPAKAKPIDRGPRVSHGHADSPCGLCGLTVPESDLASHWEAAHPTVTCPNCKKIVPRLELPTHMRSHSAADTHSRSSSWDVGGVVRGGLCSGK
jgi:hypothetical protein